MNQALTGWLQRIVRGKVRSDHSQVFYLSHLSEGKMKEADAVSESDAPG